VPYSAGSLLAGHLQKLKKISLHDCKQKQRNL
jgi:hypothetical protein